MVDRSQVTSAAIGTIATIATAVLGLALAPPLSAQAGPGSPLGSTRDAIAARIPVDSLVALAGPRTEGEIDEALEAADRMRRTARNRRSLTERARDHARAAREVEEKEIERLERAREIAEDLDQDARKERIERDRELRERYRDFIELQAQAYEEGMSVAEREEKYARVWRDKLQAERRLTRDVREWRRLHSEGAVWSAAAERRAEMAKTMNERLKEFFEAERDVARERERLAESRRHLAERRLELLERRRELLDD